MEGSEAASGLAVARPVAGGSVEPEVAGASGKPEIAPTAGGAPSEPAPTAPVSPLERGTDRADAMTVVLAPHELISPAERAPMEGPAAEPAGMDPVRASLRADAALPPVSASTATGATELGSPVHQGLAAASAPLQPLMAQVPRPAALPEPASYPPTGATGLAMPYPDPWMGRPSPSETRPAPAAMPGGPLTVADPLVATAAAAQAAPASVSPASVVASASPMLAVHLDPVSAEPAQTAQKLVEPEPMDGDPSPTAQRLLASLPAAFSMSNRRLPTGDRRLDELLSGGFPVGATLVLGLPFCGKRVLIRQLTAAALRLGVPTTVVVHTQSALVRAAQLAILHPSTPNDIASGRLRLVDLHGSPHLTDSPLLPHQILDELRQPPPASTGPVAELWVIESASALLLEAGHVEGYTIMRAVLSLAEERNAVVILSMETGMTGLPDLQAIKHLCGGMVELRRRNESCALRIEGLVTSVARPGWIDYLATPTIFTLTGSFATKMIPR